MPPVMTLGAVLAVRIKLPRIAVDEIRIGVEAVSAAAWADFIEVDQVLIGSALALATNDQAAFEVQRVDAGRANLGCGSNFRPDVNSLCPRRQSSICVIEYFTPALASMNP